MTTTLHINRTLIGALSERPDPSREVILWIDKDTGLQSVADGTQWVDVGGGGGYPGVTADGLSPAGITVAGAVKAATFAVTDNTQLSAFDGGITVNGQGVAINPDPGVDGFEVRWNDSGIARLMYRATSDGVNWFNTPVRLHAQIQTGQAVAHSLGAYSGNAVPIYAEDGTTLLGYFPLYA